VVEALGLRGCGKMPITSIALEQPTKPTDQPTLNRQSDCKERPALGPDGIPWAKMSITAGMDDEVGWGVWLGLGWVGGLVLGLGWVGGLVGVGVGVGVVVGGVIGVVVGVCMHPPTNPLTRPLQPRTLHPPAPQTRAKIRREKNRVAARKCRAKKWVHQRGRVSRGWELGGRRGAIGRVCMLYI